MLEIGTSIWIFNNMVCLKPFQIVSFEIITIEQNPNKFKRAKENFQKSELLDMISIKKGLAMILY